MKIKELFETEETFKKYIKRVRKTISDDKADILKKMREKVPGIVNVSLYGSYATGKANENSDVDLLVTYKGEKNEQEVASKLRPFPTRIGMCDIVVKKVE